MVRLHCSIALSYRAQERSTFILNVLPAETAHQAVVDEDLELPGSATDFDRFCTAEGTRYIRFNAAVGDLRIRSRFVVDIRHRLDAAHELAELSPAQLPTQILQYILPSRYCESDKLMPFAREQFGTLKPGYARIKAIADWVRANVRFKAGSSRWDTSAVDTLARREGVCRDFAHLMIAICRALNIPARFVTGVDYGADPGLGPIDFHAYVEASLSGRWYLFDPTGISPTTGLIRIGTGRDAADVAFATIFGNVASTVPVLAIEAVADRDADLQLPWRTDAPVSTTIPAVMLAEEELAA